MKVLLRPKVTVARGTDLADAQAMQRLALTQIMMANSITSLRDIGRRDWRVFVEHQSAMEAVLRDDPSGHYRLMTFATRDAYRHVVERIAKRTGHSEVSVASRAVEFARAQSLRSPPDAVEARQRQHHFAVMRRLPADKAGVAALGDDADACGSAGLYHGGNFCCAGGAHYGQGVAALALAPVQLPGAQVAFIQDVGWANDATQLRDQWVVGAHGATSRLSGFLLAPRGPRRRRTFRAMSPNSRLTSTLSLAAPAATVSVPVLSLIHISEPTRPY